MIGVELLYSTLCHTFIHLSTTVKYVHKNCHGTIDSIFYNYLRESMEQNPKTQLFRKNGCFDSNSEYGTPLTFVIKTNVRLNITRRFHTQKIRQALNTSWLQLPT